MVHYGTKKLDICLQGSVLSLDMRFPEVGEHRGNLGLGPTRAIALYIEHFVKIFPVKDLRLSVEWIENTVLQKQAIYQSSYVSCYSQKDYI